MQILKARSEGVIQFILFGHSSVGQFEQQNNAAAQAHIPLSSPTLQSSLSPLLKGWMKRITFPTLCDNENYSLSKDGYIA